MATSTQRRTLRTVHVPVRVRGRYDAAVTNDENRRHWANADRLSADAANSPEVRRILRNRARYEVANNSYARGIVLTLANDVHRHRPAAADAHRRRRGQPRRSSRSSAAGPRRSAWPRSSAPCGWPGPRTARRLPCWSPIPRSIRPVKLDLRLIEADQVATPDLTAASLAPTPSTGSSSTPSAIRSSTTCSRAIRATARGGSRWTTTACRPASMIHYFRADRPGQSRGIPEITPALPLFAQLRRYTLAVLAAAETAADFAAVLYTDAPANGEADPVEPMDLVELERRMATVLPGGWKLGQVQAEQPATTYGEFKREILNEIARCLNMPFNVAAGNSLGLQLRLRPARPPDLLQVHPRRPGPSGAGRARPRAARPGSTRRFSISELLAAAGCGRPPSATWRTSGSGTARSTSIPAKEANAQATRLANHTTTLAYEYARQGRDWESELRQRAKEVALMQELGLTHGAAATGRRRRRRGRPQSEA